MSGLEDILQTAAEIRKDFPSIKGELTPEIRGFIDELGQEYEPALLPPDIDRGPLGSCFDTCHINIMFNAKYQYVEGMATDADTGEFLYHSWLTDGDHSFDPTWKATDNRTGKEAAPAMIRYIGIPIPGAFVTYFVQHTGYAGVLGNRHRYSPAVDKMLEYRRRQLREFNRRMKP